MRSGLVVSIHVREGAAEVTLRGRFTPAQLAILRSLPGRRWDATRRLWVAPDPDAVITTLREKLPEARVVVERADTPPPRPESSPRPKSSPGLEPSRPSRITPPTPSGDPLDRVRDALVLRGYSPRTRKVYLGHLRRFLAWCDQGGAPLLQDPAARCQAYLLHLVDGRTVSRSYQNQVVSALRFLCESVMGQPALALRVPRPKREHRLPAVLSSGEVARLLARARNPKHRALLMLLYSAGLRVGEVVRLRTSDLDVERGLVRVRSGKGVKDRYTLLAKRAVEAVKIYLAAYPSDGWLFPGARPDRHLSSRSVQRVVKCAAQRAGLSKDVTTHTLRHSFATHLLEGGTNLRVIQEFLGHQSARTTQIYTHVATSTLAAVRSPLDNLAEP